MATINGIEELYAFLKKASAETLAKRPLLSTEVREILIGEDTVLNKKQLIRDLFSRLVKEKPEPHPHAKSMMEYALTALESKTPYTQWRMLSPNGSIPSLPLTIHPNWAEGVRYERMRPVIKVNGYAVPEPMIAPPADGTVVHYPIDYPPYWDCALYMSNSDESIGRLQSGVLHYTKEAAIMHSKARLGLLK